MLTDELHDAIKKYARKLDEKRPANQENYRLYYQKAVVPFLGIHDSAKQRTLSFVLGWASQPVDMLNERINYLNFYAPGGGEWVDTINNSFTVNDFSAVENALQRDTGCVGTTYSNVWYGDENAGEPSVFITPESPLSTIGTLNPRNGLVEKGCQFYNKGGDWYAILYTKNETYSAVKLKNKNEWEELRPERIEHGLGQTPLFQIVNNADTMYPLGRTEITPAIKSIYQEGVRTFGDSSRIRSYFADPIRFIRGLETKGLMDTEGRLYTDFSQLSNRINTLPYNEDAGYSPEVQELTPNDPNIILESLDRLGKLMAREIGVSPSQIGFDTVNPASAEAMNEADKGLILRAQTRIPQYAKTYKQMARFVLKLKGIDVPTQELESLDVVFKRPSTPTPATFADFMSKMKAVGMFEEELPSFVYRGMEMNAVEIDELKEWLAKKQGV